MSVIFAAIVPHPPLILPSVGSEEDRIKVQNTISEMERLGGNLKKKSPKKILISSPHPDWGFEVPLFFLAKNFKGDVKEILMGSESPSFYFDKGQEIFRKNLRDSSESIALVASADLSHRLKENGPYGFHPDGPAFDEELMNSLREKEFENILNLDEKYPEAGECGLRSISFLLGMLEESGLDYDIDILSYECPFGVGYLVVEFIL
jgi:aromatic ring-opening dioxygenase LigB subunit